MSDEAQSQTPGPSLKEQHEAIYQDMRANDPTIKRYEARFITLREKIRQLQHLRALAQGSIWRQEQWLREEAGSVLRKKVGVRTIPGFASRRDPKPADFKQRTENRLRAAVANVQAELPPT